MSCFVHVLRLLLLLLLYFKPRRDQVFFHWGRSDSKSSQVSRTLLSILADINHGGGQNIIGPFYLKSCQSFLPASRDYSKCTNIIIITVTLMTHSYFFFFF